MIFGTENVDYAAAQSAGALYGQTIWSEVRPAMRCMFILVSPISL